MCNYYSCILTRDGTVHDSSDSSSHDDIITANNLDDSKLKDRDFIRIEITPINNMDIFSTDRSDWTLTVDEPHTIPGWYEEDMSSLNERCWKAWENAVQRDIHSKMDVPKMLAMFEEIKAIRWMQNREEPLPKWELFDKRSMAIDAARNTVRDAVWDAIWDAVWVAELDAVWVAVWDAVRNAVWVAELDAVRNAAGDAVWDVRLYILTHSIPGIDQVHKDHMEQRMEVWRRGYGCLYDIDGKLYVYRRV